MDFSVLAEHRGKMNEREKIEENFNLGRERKQHEYDGGINSS